MSRFSRIKDEMSVLVSVIVLLALSLIFSLMLVAAANHFGISINTHGLSGVLVFAASLTCSALALQIVKRLIAGESALGEGDS